jgi:pantothenate synthetase
MYRYMHIYAYVIHEGKARPDFFRGVASIVCKLFNIVQPTYAYFGQKDISQGILIRSMVSFCVLYQSE